MTSTTLAPAPPVDADVIVVGSGFGGMGAALRAAESGARVVLLERLTYPGGCASTFSHAGYRFEAGATLSSGFGEGQLFHRWSERHGFDLELESLDPVIEFRAPGFTTRLPSTRTEFIEALCAVPGASPAAVRAFMELQGRVGDLLWGLLDDPALLPPFGPGGVAGHLCRAPRYASLARLASRPLGSVLRTYGLDECPAIVDLLDALCQITIQCTAQEAETPFALGTLDYTTRGTAHVVGGIGQLATALVSAFERCGGDVRYATPARRLRLSGRTWTVETPRGAFRAPHVVLNVLPHTAAALLGEAAPDDLDPLRRSVEDGWGACMLYLVVRPPPGEEHSAHHLQLVGDRSQPFTSGNHVFCSVSGPRDTGRAPDGLRTMTVSTHVPMRTLREHVGETRANYVADIQRRMRATIEKRAPEWLADVAFETTASPRTFERFTGRYLGYVGGIPRRAGWQHYMRLGPRQTAPGVWLVGDSVFPGQSTLATALGGVKTAEAVMGRLPAVVV